MVDSGFRVQEPKRRIQGSEFRSHDAGFEGLFLNPDSSLLTPQEDKAMQSLKLGTKLIAVLLIAGVALVSGRAAGGEEETKLIDVLKSGADQKAKADACMSLARYGTKDAVPALAALLTDEKLSHMARYGLEPIPDPSVDVALREALGKVKGRLLTGVIGSCGVRHDSQAIQPIAALLQD
jgi:hypothetical protein